MNGRRVSLLAVVLLLAAVVGAGVAGAKGKLLAKQVVRPGIGAGSVWLGDPEAEATAVWGAPQFCHEDADSERGACVWDSTIKGLAVGPFVSITSNPRGEINLIAIAKPGWKTPQGIGVGSTRAQTLAAHRGWARLAPGVSTIGALQLRHGGSKDPRSVTQFHFTRNRVSMISVLLWNQD